MYLVKTKTRHVARRTTATTRTRGSARQWARTAATRERLLAAAERIFARDGFSAARLEDIAATAGYTRGAFYANFDDKEDLFFALLEHWVNERVAQVNALLRKCKDADAMLRALREYYAQNAKNRRLALLSLEFALYAVRHPKAHAGLRARRRRLRSCGGGILRKVMRALGRSLPISTGAASTGLGALSTALLLEHLVDPKAVSEHDMRHLLAMFFDSVVSEST
ncbi:MAG TPA: TetR/AcrR family transcriptional regulator [Candidatus Acidoferrum sp.]|nr:TetR/AcrR family transcriptional regulator [Candidatus Acidoferrum sp.]